jgi:hypothetical protein
VPDVIMIAVMIAVVIAPVALLEISFLVVNAE